MSELSVIEQTLLKLVNLGEALKEDLEPRITGGELMPLTEKARLYLQMDAVLDACREITTCINKHQPTIAERIEKDMTQQGMDEIKVAGKIFKPDTKNYIGIKGGHKEKVIEWLKNDMIGRELVKEDVHPATLSKFIEEHFIDAGKELPFGISVFSKPVLKVTTSRSKS